MCKRWRVMRHNAPTPVRVQHLEMPLLSRRLRYLLPYLAEAKTANLVYETPQLSMHSMRRHNDTFTGTAHASDYNRTSDWWIQRDAERLLRSQLTAGNAASASEAMTIRADDVQHSCCSAPSKAALRVHD